MAKFIVKMRDTVTTEHLVEAAHQHEAEDLAMDDNLPKPYKSVTEEYTYTEVRPATDSEIADIEKK